jgi:hypothetical protein
MKTLLQLGGLLLGASTAQAQCRIALILQSTHEYATALAGAKQALLGSITPSNRASTIPFQAPA